MSGEGCTDSDIRAGGYGSTDYWSRFFAGAKDGGVSRIATIVATDATTRDCATEFAKFCDTTVPAACAGNGVDCNGPSRTGACCDAIFKCDNALFAKAQRCHVLPSPGLGSATAGYQITGQWNGCKSQASDGGVDFTAIYAPRYAAVARGTGGIASRTGEQ